MRSLLIFLLIFLWLGAFTAFAQGGKAEPKRLSIDAGASSAPVAGTLRNGQEMEYIFAANKGQTVTISNATSSQFDFRVYHEEYFSEGDFDSSPTYTFEIPETGDYLFTVRKKQTATRSARFSMRIKIK